MKRLFILCSALFLICSCGDFTDTNSEIEIVNEVPEPIPYENPDFDLEYSLAVEKGNMKVIPVVANQDFSNKHANFGSYMIASEALENGSLIISETAERAPMSSTRQSNELSANTSISPSMNRMRREMSYNNGGAVNQLRVENTSDQDTVYVMAGEIVDGGRQDRVIAEDLIVSPGESLNVAVFCVEHGRWSYESGDQEFAYGSTIANSIRFQKSQSEVWSDVSKYSIANNASSSTGTYMSISNNENVREQLDAYHEVFDNALESNDKIIGVVCVSGDQVIACDLFHSNDLFSKQWKSLVEAYGIEAITNGDEPVLRDEKISAQFAEFKSNFNEGKGEEEANVSHHGGTTLHFAGK